MHLPCASGAQFEARPPFFLVAFLWSIPCVWQTASGECGVEENVAYGGTNIQVSLNPFFPLGCVDAINVRECCSLCEARWPDCKSFLWVRSTASGHGLNPRTCCLQQDYRASPTANDYADSGYSQFGCYMTSTCTLQITGTGLGAGDSISIHPDGATTCAGSTLASWDGITNPSTATGGANNVYDFGVARTGDVGLSYLLCYRSGGVGADVIVGEFVMRGPHMGQTHFCTLGGQCNLQLTGVGLVSNDAFYQLLIAEPDTSNPGSCGTNPTRVDFPGFANPGDILNDAYDDVYEMRTTLGGDTSRSFNLCWANDPQNAAYLDFTHLVGTFQLYGPMVGDKACTMGIGCNINLGGSGLSTSNALLVVVGADATVCGQTEGSDLGPSFVNPKAASTVTPYDFYDFGVATSPHLDQPGSGYRIGYQLCWAQSPALAPPNSNINEFTIHLGAFTLHGPINVDQRCYFTAPCILQLTGSGFEDFGAQIVADSSCDPTGDGLSPPTLPNIQDGTWTNPINGTDTGIVTFGVATRGLIGDSYIVCYEPQFSLDSFRVRVGDFLMGGPLTQTGTSCTLGVACLIQLVGVGMENTNRIRIIESANCGGADAILSSFPPMSTDDLVNPATLFYRPSGTFAGGEMWAQFPMTSLPTAGLARAGYALCWSHDPQSPLDYSFYVGDFAMVGINVGDQSCTLGLQCILQVQGHALANTNGIVALATNICADAELQLAVFVQAVGGYWSNRQIVEDVDPWDTYILGTPITGTPGTFYTLCWAHDPGIAGAPEYRVTVGKLTINGPEQPNFNLALSAFECVLSLPCIVNLQGTGLNESNQIIIIDAPVGSGIYCGDPNLQVSNFGGITNPKQAAAADPGVFDMGIANSGLPGSEYLICWGHDPQTTAEFNVPLSTFTLRGADQYAAGVPVSQQHSCTLGEACSITLTGHQLRASNQIVLTAFSDSCGEPDLNVAVFSGASNPASPTSVGALQTIYDIGVPVSGFPGDYTICWTEVTTHTNYINDYHDYHVRVGTLRLSGPEPQDRSCTLSEPCMVRVDGVGLQHGSRVLIIERTSDCSSSLSNSDVSAWTDFINPAPSATLVAPPVGIAYSDGDIYDFGTGIAGVPGQYKLCWSFAPGAQPSEYLVYFGMFTMNGPIQNVYLSCILGQPCNMQINGVGLSWENYVQIIVDDAEDCGSTNVLPANLQGIQNPRQVTDDDSDNRYVMGLVTVGGSYAACRVPSPAETCIGSHYKLCWAHGVTHTAQGGLNLAVEIGTFAMSGPFVTYSVDCKIGSVCAFRIYGSSFAMTNRILLIEEHGSCGDVDPPAAIIPGLLNPQRASQVAADGTEATYRLGRSTGGSVARYRVCWGFNPLIPRHFNIEVGPFYLSAPPSHCTYPDGLTLTCASP